MDLNIDPASQLSSLARSSQRGHPPLPREGKKQSRRQRGWVETTPAWLDIKRAEWTSNVLILDIERAAH